MEDQQFYTIVTTTGKAKIANATALGTKINFTTLKVGDGNGNYYEPTESQIDLVHTVWEGSITNASIDPNNPNWIVIAVVIPADVGGFMIREVGVFDDTGSMLAIGKYPETYKPTAEAGSTKDLTIKIILEVSNTASITLKVDPNIIIATKADFNALAGTGRTTETVKGNADAIDSLTTQMADRANYNEQAYKNLNFLKDNGIFAVIGDSIGAGYGISNYNDMWVKKLQDFFNTMSGYNDFETITNFAVANTYGITINGTHSIGSLGASKQSLIMQPGATISFNGNIQFIDFIYHQTPDSGKLQVDCNGTIYKTVDCNGLDVLDKTSFPTSSSNNTTNATYTITCLNASVEITGLIRLVKKSDYGNANIIRCAVSGEDTTYFCDPTTLAAIQKTTNLFGTTLHNKVYFIALGTNDIYNSNKAKSSSVFSTNLETMIKTFLNDSNDVRIILTVPPLADETLWPIQVEPHSNYRNVVYILAEKYNLTVIDYTYIDFVLNNWLQDGLHPNVEGNAQMDSHILKTLSIVIKKTPKTIPYVKVTAITQSVANSSFASVTFNAEVNDTDNIFNLSYATKLTCNTAGFYNIFATIDFASNVTGFRIVTFRINGSSYIGQNYGNAINGLDHYLSTNTGYYLNKGDYIEVQVYQTSGAVLNLLGAVAGMFKID